MTLVAFQSLQDYKQERIIFNEGKLLNFKMEDDILSAQYSVHFFVVDVSYDAGKNLLTLDSYKVKRKQH